MKEENQRQKDWKERDTRLSPETVQTDSTGEMLSNKTTNESPGISTTARYGGEPGRVEHQGQEN